MLPPDTITNSGRHKKQLYGHGIFTKLLNMSF